MDDHKDYANKNSIVSNYTQEISHMFNWENVTILGNESNWHKRGISEMLYINVFNKTLNRKEDAPALSYIYKPITISLKRLCS